MKKFPFSSFNIYKVNDNTYVKVISGSTAGVVVAPLNDEAFYSTNVEATWTPNRDSYGMTTGGTLIEQPKKQLIQELDDGVYTNSETGRQYLRLNGVTFRETDEGKFVKETRDWNLRLEQTHAVEAV